MGRGGGSGGGECGTAVGGLFAFDTKGPPFRWLAGPSAPSGTAPGPLSAGPVGEDSCPEDLFPCSHSGKGRSSQLLMSPWEPEAQATTSTPEPATALMYQQQAGRSLAPIAGWMGYPAGQRPRSIPLWSVRGFHNHLPIYLLRLTLSIHCVLSLSLSFLPSLLPFHLPPPRAINSTTHINRHCACSPVVVRLYW
jgi:hypothetical protein